MNFLTSSYTKIWRFRKSNLRVSNLGEDLQTHAANLSFHLPALPWKLNTMESLLICFSVVVTSVTGEMRGCSMLLFRVTASLWGTLHRNSWQGPEAGTMAEWYSLARSAVFLTLPWSNCLSYQSTIKTIPHRHGHWSIQGKQFSTGRSLFPNDPKLC